MTWISIVLFILTHVSDIIDIVKKIIELIHGLPRAEQLQARMDFSHAIKSGDLQKVRDVANQWGNRV